MDFWEYDPAANSWTQKADFGNPGDYREFAVGFSIGSKGYIGTGYVFGSDPMDFWEYDPATDTWTQKADFGGGPREFAVGFSIGSKGYIGTGFGIYTGITPTISGNMIPRPMPGHRKPISVAHRDNLQSDFPSATKGISVLAQMTRDTLRISGSILRTGADDSEDFEKKWSLGGSLFFCFHGALLHGFRLTRSRPNYSAHKGGIIRWIKLAFHWRARRNTEHGNDSTWDVSAEAISNLGRLGAGSPAS